jgi:hypothetical protein
MLERLPEFKEIAARVEALRAARLRLEQKRKSLGSVDRELRARREKAKLAYHETKADFDSLVGSYKIAVAAARMEPPDSPRRKTLQKEADRQKEKVDKLDVKLNKARADRDAAETAYRDRVQSKLADNEREVARAEDDLKKITGDLDRFAKTAVRKSWKFGSDLRKLPILDAFSSPTKVKEMRLPDLPIDYDLKKAPSDDRSTNK